jgi:lauroyl/myristoyl acyltransferase
MYYLLRPIERYVRRHLASELNRQRFDRAKRFVDEAERRGTGDEMAFRVHARWLKFLSSQPSVQNEMWPKDIGLLRQFATVFGLPSAESRKFVGLSLLGELWRIWCSPDLPKGPPEVVAALTRVTGWEHFERCRRDRAGLILVPVHSQFSHLLRPYFRHRGLDALELGLEKNLLEERGFRTPAAKRFELARQMHAAKQLLARGGLVCNLPDSHHNLDNSRTVEFFGRKRPLAAGFAELALRTGAHVVPIAHRFSARGFFVVEFGAPFHVLGRQSTPDERVDSLVGQYANFLRDEWRRYPWNIPWHQLRYFCRLPEVDRDAHGERVHVPSASEARAACEELAR